MSREGKAKVLNESELKRVIKVLSTSKHAKRNIALLYFSFGLGLRAKEMSSLNINDVLNPDHTMKDELNLLSTYTKNSKQRHVYLSNPKVRKALSEHLKHCNLNYLDTPLFLSQKGGRFSPNTLQMLFARMYADAGIVGASSHSGRRTYATRLIENGVDIKAVSTLMGHASISMTAEYVHTSPDRMKRIAQIAI
ncbi:MAG: site-specific integrase [Methylococcales bacterium]